MYKWILAIVVLLFVLESCHKGVLEPEAFIHWVENPDNGLKQQQTLSNERFQLQYKPREYVLLKEFKYTSLSDSQAQQLFNELDSIVFLTFRLYSTDGTDLLAKGASDPSQILARQGFLHSQHANHFQLVQDGQPQVPTEYEYINTYGLTPYMDFLLAFEADPGRPMQLIWDDPWLGHGLVSFQISKRSLNKMPKVNMN